MSDKTPLYDNVIVKLDKRKDVTYGGLYIPGGVDKESDSTGVVIEVGDGIRLKNGNIIPLSVAVGDRVVFRKDTGVAMGIDGESVIIIRESELFGVLEK